MHLRLLRKFIQVTVDDAWRLEKLRSKHAGFAVLALLVILCLLEENATVIDTADIFFTHNAISRPDEEICGNPCHGQISLITSD